MREEALSTALSFWTAKRPVFLIKSFILLHVESIYIMNYMEIQI